MNVLQDFWNHLFSDADYCAKKYNEKREVFGIKTLLSPLGHKMSPSPVAEFMGQSRIKHDESWASRTLVCLEEEEKRFHSYDTNHAHFYEPLK